MIRGAAFGALLLALPSALLLADARPLDYSTPAR